MVLGADPARAYQFGGGVVVFGQQQRAGQAADSLIVNLWTQDRAAAAPWSLQQLEQHLEAETGGSETPQRLRRQLHAAVAASLAAALPTVRRAADQLAGFQGGSFEVLGVDFMVDASLRPWLVEVNRLPSMARKVVACASNATAGGDDGDGGGRCEQDVPFDVQKERFIGALLQLLMHRHSQHAGLAQQAEQLLQAASDVALEEEQPPCLDAAQLQQLLAMQAEQAEAERLGFVPLTTQLYRSLECMATQPSSSNGSNPCDVLAELAPPGLPTRQECSAPAPPGSHLLAWLHGWGNQLRLQAASVLPRLRHSAARRPQTKTAAAAYQLRPSDERLLAWMQHGSHAIASLQALRDFCNGSRGAAAQ